MIVVIAGATATGKTKIAQKLAKKFNGYIVNGDSRQIYKELNIGTDKPTPKEIEKSGSIHELFGHISIDEKYNLFRYQTDVKRVLKKHKNQPAFLVGGTGLYIDSVVYNYELKEQNNNLRREKLNKLTLKELQALVGENLKKLNKSDQNNPRRLIRFIEKGQQFYKRGKPLKHLYIVIEKDFEFIEKNIADRIEQMFKNGLLQENEKLFKLGKHKKTNTIGYKEFEDFFKGDIGLDEVKKRIFLNTRKYAKRQITWFKRNKNSVWVKDYDEALRICEKFLA